MTSTIANRVAAAGGAIALMIAGAGAAQAHPSHHARATAVKPFLTNLIVVETSMGGIALGESPATVRKHFPKKDCSAYACQYDGPGYHVTVQFGVKPKSKKATVDAVTLSTTTGKDTATKVRTASGVGLGATYAKAKKGLKHAKYAGNKTSGYFYYFTGKGGVGSYGTVFYITNGVVNLIDVERVDHVG